MEISPVSENINLSLLSYFLVVVFFEVRAICFLCICSAPSSTHPDPLSSDMFFQIQSHHFAICESCTVILLLTPPMEVTKLEHATIPTLFVEM
jgi:hypothetical protein